jgi:hypothetical protein
MGVEEIGYVGVDYIPLAQDGDQHRTPVNTTMNLSTPQKEGNFSTTYAITSF